MAYVPEQESLKGFHLRFNEVADLCAVPLMGKELAEAYLSSLDRGDQQLALQVCMNLPVYTLPLHEL